MTTLCELRGRPHWSYSSLNLLLNICSLKWYFEKIEKLPRPFTPLPLAFGSAYHRVMEWIAMNRMDGRLPTESDTRDLFNENWKRQIEEEEDIQFSEKDDADTCGQRGMDMCAAYLGQVDPEEQVVAISEVFAVPIGDSDKPLIGELDCVVSHADTKTVVDWKTSARRWPKDQADKSSQATAYLFAYEQLHGEIPGFRFDVAVKNKTPVIEHNHTFRTTDDFQRLEAMLTMAERIISQEFFYPNEQCFSCSSCAFRAACREWHRKREAVISTAA